MALLRGPSPLGIVLRCVTSLCRISGGTLTFWSCLYTFNMFLDIRASSLSKNSGLLNYGVIIKLQKPKIESEECGKHVIMCICCLFAKPGKDDSTVFSVLAQGVCPQSVLRKSPTCRLRFSTKLHAWSLCNWTVKGRKCRKWGKRVTGGSENPKSLKRWDLTVPTQWGKRKSTKVPHRTCSFFSTLCFSTKAILVLNFSLIQKCLTPQFKKEGDSSHFSHQIRCLDKEITVSWVPPPPSEFCGHGSLSSLLTCASIFCCELKPHKHSPEHINASTITRPWTCKIS